MLIYPDTITLPEPTVTFLTELLQAHRARLRTWHELPTCDQTLPVLAHLPRRETYPQFGRQLRHR